VSLFLFVVYSELMMMQSLSVWGMFRNCSPEVNLSWEEEGSFTEMFFDYAMCHIVMRDM